ncbi:MAG: hypothetical protein AMXMBFR47_11900 [Planctomycetota bacterium]
MGAPLKFESMTVRGPARSARTPERRQVTRSERRIPADFLRVFEAWIRARRDSGRGCYYDFDKGVCGWFSRKKRLT